MQKKSLKSQLSQCIYVLHLFSPQEQVEKCEQNIEDHEGYITKYKDSMEWIRSQEAALGDCTDTPRDNEALEEKLETIQVGLSTPRRWEGGVI